MRTDPILIEGYASLFGEEDLAGDVVRAGAFARSLARADSLAPMLLQHENGKVAGRWLRLREDGRGLYVRGLVEPVKPSGKLAVRSIAARALDGLSIGFVAHKWSPRIGGGRELLELDLKEISLVATPMAPKARFTVMSEGIRAVA